jgi:hypothetical protein
VGFLLASHRLTTYDEGVEAGRTGDHTRQRQLARGQGFGQETGPRIEARAVTDTNGSSRHRGCSRQRGRSADKR